jgi:exodeoxyribonuclease VII large subunit
LQTLTLFPERRIFSVTELASEARLFLERQFLDVWVQGEISNFRRPQSGHFYFTLKDRGAQLKVVCFKTHNRLFKFRVEDGLKLLVRGRLSLYEARGDFQLIADYMEPTGTGTLQHAFEQLKRRLHDEGLFDASHKRALPSFPRCIGVVTSPTGAAIQDILRVMRRRNRQVHILIYPVRVQGEAAAQEIVQGVRYLESRGDIDTIVIARGGGSLEDLAPFNDEKLARAIVQCAIPVISAVGHEIDFTICDFVADLRAPTPSAAAEIVSQTQEELCERVRRAVEAAGRSLLLMIERRRSALQRLASGRAFGTTERRLSVAAQRLDDLTLRLEASCHSLLRRKGERCLESASRLGRLDLHRRLGEAAGLLETRMRLLQRSAEQILQAKRNTLAQAAGTLNAYSPLAALQRGYAIVRKENRQVVKSVRDVHVGEDVRIFLHHGELTCRIQGMKS